MPAYLVDNTQLRHKTNDPHKLKELIYRECCRSNKGLWYIWVYQLEPGTSGQDYTCEISVLSADHEEMLTCKSRPLSLDYTKVSLTITKMAYLTRRSL